MFTIGEHAVSNYLTTRAFEHLNTSIRYSLVNRNKQKALEPKTLLTIITRFYSCRSAERTGIFENPECGAHWG